MQHPHTRKIGYFSCASCLEPPQAQVNLRTSCCNMAPLACRGAQQEDTAQLGYEAEEFVESWSAALKPSAWEGQGGRSGTASLYPFTMVYAAYLDAVHAEVKS